MIAVPSSISKIAGRHVPLPETKQQSHPPTPLQIALAMRLSAASLSGGIWPRMYSAGKTRASATSVPRTSKATETHPSTTARIVRRIGRIVREIAARVQPCDRRHRLASPRKEKLTVR